MNIRTEYPRPQFERKDWICLNGEWDFTVDNSRTGTQRGYQNAEHFDEKIIVPFCPESKLSGIEHKDFMNGVWYTRTVNIPDVWLDNRRTFINIGACDYITRVYVNGGEVGLHRGGYVSFSFDITDFLKKGENRISIYAEDDTRSSSVPSGKQSNRYDSYGCFYTRTTGIWQTVWLENTPNTYIKSVKMTPLLEKGVLRVEYTANAADGKKITAEAFLDGVSVGKTEQTVNWDNGSFDVALSEVALWSIEDPTLYDIVFTLDEDRGESYFGMRSIVFRDGKTYINGKSVFQRLILDQGYYPDGIYTAPSDEELIADIKRSQAMGYNGARLHEKVFEERFLYHADRLGYIVWGEYPNWGLDVTKDSCYKNMLPEWLEELKRDYNHPSLIGWCPLNETTRGIDAEFVRFIFNLTKAYDPTRLFIDNSGWHHIAGTYDMFDVHNYCDDAAKFRENYDRLTDGSEAEYLDGNDGGVHIMRKSSEICFVSEFGGARWVAGENGGNNWGYGEQVKNVSEFIERYRGLVDALLDNPKISAFCYTQLTDVEQEQNGLYTYDRRAKFDPNVIKEITARKAAVEE